MCRGARRDRLHVQRDGRKDLVEAASRSSGRRCIWQPIRRPEKCRTSAKDYDDQVGDADGEDAADGSQQQDALKSGHSAPPRQARARLVEPLCASTIICFPETVGAGATFAPVPLLGSSDADTTA